MAGHPFLDSVRNTVDCPAAGRCRRIANYCFTCDGIALDTGASCFITLTLATDYRELAQLADEHVVALSDELGVLRLRLLVAQPGRLLGHLRLERVPNCLRANDACATHEIACVEGLVQRIGDRLFRAMRHLRERKIMLLPDCTAQRVDERHG